MISVLCSNDSVNNTKFVPERPGKCVQFKTKTNGLC